MDWKDKLALAHQKVAAGAGTVADEVLTTYLPKIRVFFAEKVGPKLLESMKDDEAIAELSKFAHGLLPPKVRWVVGEKRFVQFCLANRDKLVGSGQTPPPLPKASETNSPQHATVEGKF